MGILWLDAASDTWDERMRKGKKENLKTKFHLFYFVLGPTTEKPNIWDVNIIFVTNPDSSLLHRAPGEFEEKKKFLRLPIATNSLTFRLTTLWFASVDFDLFLVL